MCGSGMNTKITLTLINKAREEVNGQTQKKAITKLRLLTINTRGIRSKLTSLTAALHTHSTHIAAITETHLNANNEVSVTGYQWIGKNRTDREGGGVGFLIRN